MNLRNEANRIESLRDRQMNFLSLLLIILGIYPKVLKIVKVT